MRIKTARIVRIDDHNLQNFDRYRFFEEDQIFVLMIIFVIMLSDDYMACLYRMIDDYMACLNQMFDDYVACLYQMIDDYMACLYQMIDEN